MANKRIAKVKRIFVRGVIPIAVIVVIVPLLLSQSSFAFDKYFGHPSLTQEIVEFYNANAERKITPEELEWIKEGSTHEDDSPRWANHFYDAVHERGLTPKYVRGASSFVEQNNVFGVTLPAPPVASVNWAENDLLQNLYGTNRTWQKAIENYDGNRREAMLGLGAILHLVEDLGVPEHARGDSHAGFAGDPESYYETYAELYLDRKGELNVAEELIAKNEKPYTNRFLDRIFRDLSLFTANRWFSEDTIRVEEFPGPKILRSSNKGSKTFYFDSNKMLFFSEFDPNKNEFMKSTNFKDIQDSWRKEAFPEIVRYGANTINIYFDAIKEREKDPTLWTIDRLQARDVRVHGLIKNVAGLRGGNTARVFTSRFGWRVFDIIVANPYAKVKIGLRRLARAITGNSGDVVTDKDNSTAASLARAPNTEGDTATDISTGGTSYEEQLTPAADSNGSKTAANNHDETTNSNDEFAPATGGSNRGQTGTANKQTGFNDDETVIEPYAFGPTPAAITLPPCQPEQLESIRYGQQSNAVTNVKACLAELGYSVLPSNYYGQQTIELIKQFYQAVLKRETAGQILGAAGVHALHDEILKRRQPAVDAPTAPSPTPAPAPTPAPIIFGSGGGGGGGGGGAAPSQNSNNSCSGLAKNVYPKIIISEFQYQSRNDTKDEFVELYNPNDTAVDLRCFQLNKFTSGSREVPPLIPASKFTGTIAAHGFFLITHPSVAARYNADLTYADSYSIAKNNVLFLVSAAGQTLDLIGYGDDGGKILAAESSPFLFTEPSAATFSIERLNLQDTDNNSLDFWLNSSPNPENSHSPTRTARADFADLRGISLTNLNDSFDQETSGLTINFREPVFSFSPANYDYRISFGTTSATSSYALINFGSSATIPAPVFQSATFTLATTLTECPETIGNYIVTVTLQDRLAAPNRTTATTSLNLTPFCNPAGVSQNHSNDSTAGTETGPIRISEILISSASSTQDEFVELYNPNGFPVNLAGFSLVRVTRTSTEQTILPVSKFVGVIQPFSFFLLANELANIGAIPDLIWAKSYNLARDNAVKLLNASGTIIDLVGWGSSPVAEGTAFPDNPTSSALQRKAGVNSTLLTLISGGFEQLYGNAFDSDTNVSDFVLAPAEPQTALSTSEPPPVAPTNLTLTLDTATVTLSFISPYRPTSSALTYELRRTSSNLSEAEVQSQWSTLTSVNVSLPTVRIGGYNESVSFKACGQVSQNDYLLLGLVRGGALVGFARVQLTGSPSCAPVNNITLTTSQDRRQCEPVVLKVSATNTSSSIGQNFTVSGNDVSLTGSVPTSPSQTFLHAVEYGGCVGYVSSSDYTYTLTASGVDGSGATVDLTSQLFDTGTITPPNNPTDYLTTTSLTVPAGYKSIKFSFVGTKRFGQDLFHFSLFTETFEVVTQ